jgi:hypothetical protein
MKQGEREEDAERGGETEAGLLSFILTSAA